MEPINPQVLPSTLPKKEHHKSAMVGLWAAFGAIIIGLLYWWLVSAKLVPTPTSSLPKPRDPRLELVEATATDQPMELSAEQRTKLQALVKSSAKAVPVKMSAAELQAQRTQAEATR
jgi:hypothetical protein